jgi:hypothetical protein
LAICLFPDSKRRAQVEIDAFTERLDRLPNTNEKDQFPYLCALISEVYRWAVVAPMGIPHMITEDVMYEGHIIPKNVTILINAWSVKLLYFDGCLLNLIPGLCPRTRISTQIQRISVPRDFWARSRSLILVNLRSALGDGDANMSTQVQLIHMMHRMCPGVDLADTMMFLALSAILAVFDISPLEDSPPTYAFSDRFSR